MSRRRHATRAVTAAAGIAFVGAGGFGLLVQPHAAAAGAVDPHDICIVPNLICIPTGGSSTPAPTSTGTTSTSASPSDTASGTPSDTASVTPSSLPSESINPQPSTYSFSSQPSATQAVVTGPPPGPNLAVSHLVIRKLKGKLDAEATVTNTGTVLMQDVPLTVSATGLTTQNWTVTLNPGQHLSFHTRWPFRATPKTKTVVVTIDPQNLVAETSKADNRISGKKRFG